MSEFTYKPSSNVAFVVRNNSKKKIRIFTYPLEPGQQRDLMKIPNISEEDIRASALKGQLQFMISIGQISIISSDIDLVQFNSSQQTFLQNAGASAGLQTYVQCPNIAALEGTHDSELTTGTLAVTATIGDFFLDKTSTATIDHINVAATNSGTGRWIRKNTKLQTWINQTTWYVDPSAGSDENDGLTSGTALKTWSEWAKRTSGETINVACTINILGNLNAGDYPVTTIHVGPSGSLLIKGTTPTSLATGTFTSVTLAAPATNVPYQVTDSSKANNFWAAYTDLVSGTGTGKRVRITSGARSGVVMWPAKDLGSKNARMSAPLNPSLQAAYLYALASPAVSDPYQVEQLVNINGFSLNVQAAVVDDTASGAFYGLPRVYFKDIWVSQHSVIRTDSFFAGNVAAYGCDMGPTIVQGTFNWINCRMSRLNTNSLAAGVWGGLLPALNAGGGLEVDQGSSFVFTELRFMIQGDGSRSGVNAEGGAYTFLGSIQIFDCQHGIDCAFHSGIGLDAFLSSVEVFGSGNSGEGVVVRAGTFVRMRSSGTYKLTGTGGDTSVGGTVRTWAQLPYIASDITGGTSGTKIAGILTE